jgi:hypothetical protein
MTLASGSTAGSPVTPSVPQQSAGEVSLPEFDLSAVQVIACDIFGTTVDWRTGVAEQASRVGGDRLELRAPADGDPRHLAAAMAGLGIAAPTVDTDAGLVVLPVSDGPAVLPAVATRLADAGLRVSDLALRRPTLDDVFLTVTGQPASSSTPDTAAVGSLR